MDSTSLWNSAQSTVGVVISHATHLLMDNAQANYRHLVGVTTRAQFSRRMNFVVQMGQGRVVLLIFRDFSNKDAQMLIVIHKMIQQVRLHVLLVQITRLSSVQKHTQKSTCPFTVWAAAVPGGGRQLEYGETWKIEVNTTKNGRIWGRTNGNFNTLGRGQCQTGDCNGLLECQTSSSTPSNTLAEYASYQYNNNDFFDISLVEGFNIPMEFSPVSADECSVRIRCTADIIGQCPNELRTPGGCNNPCTVFKTNEYCCMSGNCGPTKYSRFFKDKCSTSYSYALDNSTTSTFLCPSGTSYRVVFCP